MEIYVSVIKTIEYIFLIFKGPHGYKAFRK